jgi:2-oxoglutarate dehydrogenase E2 component (dihydrolipoamide succinyltransferase)
MPVTITAPKFPESVPKGTIVRWHKQPGESVAQDEIIVEVMTDKITLEVPAPAAGVLGQILAPLDCEVVSEAALGTIEEGKAAPAPAAATPAATLAAAQEAPRLSPSARLAAAETGVDPASIAGTGHKGRVTKQDIYAAAPSAHAAPAAPVQTAPVQVAPVSVPAPKPVVSVVSGDRTEEVVPMTPLRQRIAERLVSAQHTAAILTTFNEVDMSRAMELRKRYQERFEKRYGIKLGFMSFFVRAAVEALREYPAVNAEIRGSDVVYKKFYDIGVAVGGGKGLVVPVIRDADKLGFAQIELAIADFGKRAKDNKLTLADLTGGTFTISNGGIYGSLLSTPILNPPQTGILGMHKIEERPVAINGQVVVRPMMYTALSYDHRLIDGREAVQFLVRMKECIEDPERLLLEV